MRYLACARHLIAGPAICFGSIVPSTFAGNPAAQAVRVHDGSQVNGLLGASVAGAGDVNGDGFRDYIVGIPGSNKVLVRSGISGEVLLDIPGVPEADVFGYSVASAGDVNNDGLDDIIVGDPDMFVGCMPQGGAVVFSGLDGSILHFPAGMTGWEEFGHSVAGAGDVDGDGFDDIIIGAPLRDPDCSPQSGGINILSGFHGGPLFAAVGTPGARLGSTVIGIGDVNGDGHDDVAASAPGIGKVYIYDAYNNSVLRTFAGAVIGKYGHSIANVGDLDGDGGNEIAIGAPYTGLSFMPGKVFIYNGTTGTMLHCWLGQAGDGFGFSVAGASDVNGDGFDDVAVGAPWAHVDEQSTGRVEVRSGQTGQLVKAINASSDFCRYGASVAGLGDLDGDGMSDFIVGAPQAGTSDQGAAFVYPGTPNTLGIESSDILTPSGTPTFVASGDLNNDGLPDVVTVSTALDRISIFLTAADGSLQAPINKAAGDGPNSVALGDFDLDGDQDLAVLAAKDKTILLFRNNGSGGLSKKGVLKTGKKPISLQSTDFTGDGRVDLVVAYQSTDQVALFANNNSSNFKTKFNKAKKFSVGDNPTQIVAARLNPDNAVDMLVLNKNSQDISVLLNNGNGTFTAKPSIPTEGATVKLAAADPQPGFHHGSRLAESQWSTRVAGRNRTRVVPQLQQRQSRSVDRRNGARRCGLRWLCRSHHRALGRRQHLRALQRSG